MYTLLKLIITAAVVLTIAWPMAFWGEPAVQDQAQARPIVHKAPFALVPQVDLSW
jgi:hypothetical protein